MKVILRMNLVIMLPVLAVAVSACDKLTQTSRAAQSVTQKAFDDTKSSWKEMFTYHPPVPAPLPQTRYCYHMQSDIVCYDSEQLLLTSKLVGYQDGDRMSWIQPGGGSLGASGGEPIALRPAPIPRTSIVESNYDIQPASSTAASSNRWEGKRTPTTPTIPSTTGEISVAPLSSGVQKR
ncbi:MAG: hypothetical protein ACOYNL_01345 [Rickettsiales bacterium]